MKRGLSLASPLAILTTVVLAMSPAVRPAAQTEAQRPPAFGSSLKRPKDDVKGDAGRGASGGESEEEVVRVDTSLVLLDVLVTDRTGTRAVEGLTKDDFVVVEDGRAQELSFFALGDDSQKLPRSVVLIFDRSDSQLAYLDSSVEAAKKLVNHLKPSDEMAIVTDDVQLAVGFTRDKKRLKSALDALKKYTFEGYRTRSMQFSALLATLRELVDAEKRRAVVIIQTDGDEVARLGGAGGGMMQAAGYDMDDVYAEAERSRARIYAVVPNERLLGLSQEEVAARIPLMRERWRAAREKRGGMWFGMKRLPPEQQDRSRKPPPGFDTKALEAAIRESAERVQKSQVELLVHGQAAVTRVAELTGGWASFLEKPGDADAVYARILADINQRYVVGYYPSNKALDGKLRQIKVEVRGHPEYVVQGRQSYFSRRR
ncbi:MAG TPA: VWA domain-containing protein [Pyrinomonadaceae bacterium]|jgi:VWFA-related protein|nr:VWA domain-containing protein [Pyrinomonadaceae bacterium]